MLDTVPAVVFFEVVKAMFEKNVTKGDCVIRQGEDGDFFYVVKEGSFSIYKDGVVVGEAGPGFAFGELALMYSA